MSKPVVPKIATRSITEKSSGIGKIVKSLRDVTFKQHLLSLAILNQTTRIIKFNNNIVVPSEPRNTD